MNSPIAKFQIGKLGPSEGTITSLDLVFKNHKWIRVSVLKASEYHNREKIKVLAEEICNKIAQKGNHKCEYSVIGFTIVLRRKSLEVKKKKVVKK